MPKRLLSGMQPTQPRLHLGNIEGALRNWVRLQDEFEIFCFIADWHALTSMAHEPHLIKHNTREITKDYIAGGIDLKRSIIFAQSDVKEHAELHLLFSMVTPLGWLERVPTYKEKKEAMGSEERESYGFLGYPVLQAADILMYKPHGVPVGKDQAPHLELSREIARRFNNLYGEVFPEFENVIGDIPLLLGTDGRKMSKSYDNAIYLSDTEDETAAKINSAFTTPTKIKKTDPGIPETCAVCNLLRVYSPNWETQWEEDRQGIRGCMQNKRELIECVNENLRPMRERRAHISDADVEDALKKGAERAREVAAATMVDVRAAMGMS
ncbi:MAG: tryptophan--tRNA ligase [Armatimonadetes bacterium]|nr:tryptophan--tRNA ligase [Armatimonadota bacterium]